MKSLKLTITRLRVPKYTIGKLYIDGVFFCHTLEDTVRDLGKNGEGKIYGKTAIPAGEYKVLITPSNRFKRRLPLLVNVPYFEGIRIHGGNSAEDTHGCILVGDNDQIGALHNSQAKLAELMLILDSNQVSDISIEIR